ncbi:hypothetical protein MOA67_gp035 [Klebsiella phage KpLz-2_45]|uniref:hypothetical protein n=1 Tax=Klebsiella phage KpLz-2_45 TaxID=2698923 RepID=UPI001F13CE1C|nr:hypothetical protein MOA67_gp035 [Klebsiella phage KpLz-2_45]UKS71901.1 hypothetical protein KpLz245_0350 [Klebsiella phage KpLz-2_45]
MLEQLMSFYDHILSNFKDYPMAQNAIVAASSIAVSGAIGWGLIKTPKAVVQWVKRQFVTSLVFNTSGTNWSNYNSEQYGAFLKWFAKNSWFHWSRTITIDGDVNGESAAVGPGVGSHFFLHKGTVFVFSITEIDANAASNSKYRLSISKFGRSHKPILNLMDEFMLKDTGKDNIRTFVNTTDSWNYLCRLKKRDLKTIVVTDKVQRELIDPIFDFNKSKDWYESRGLAYKFTVLLYGLPGTGKSSLISALAAALGRDIHILKPAGGLQYQALFQRAAGGVVIIEDIDTYSFTKARSKEKVIIDLKEGNKPENPEELKNTPFVVEEQSSDDKAMDEYLNGSLSDFLNALDGVLRLNDVIVFLTTNRPEKLDDALLRDGRIDVRAEVEVLGDKEIRQFFKMAFPDTEPSNNLPFSPLPGASVQALFMLNKHDPVAYENALRTYDVTKPVEAVSYNVLKAVS